MISRIGFRAISRAWFVAGLACCAVSAPTLAQDAPKPLAAVNAAKAESEKRERESVNARLLETAALIQKGEAALTAMEERVAQLERDEKSKKAVLDGRREEIGKVLSALLRMGRNPPPVVVTPREDALEAVRSAMLLASAFPELSKKATALAEELTQLIAVMDSSRAERDKLKAENERLLEERTRLTALLADKQKVLKAAQPELAAVGAEVASVSGDAGDPETLIERTKGIIASKTGLGAYEKEPPGDKKDSLVVLAPGETGVAANTDRMKPAIAFGSAKGKLPLPAQGRRVIGFGDKTQYGGQSKGAVFETRSGAQITSPCDGWVVYSSEFRSYGQLLIINAGDGYHVLLAGLSQVSVQPGQFVLAAEPVGTMANTPAPNGGQANASVLYVEFRKDNKPIDPDPWWVQKVQG